MKRNANCNRSLFVIALQIIGTEQGYSQALVWLDIGSVFMDEGPSNCTELSNKLANFWVKSRVTRAYTMYNCKRLIMVVWAFLL